MQERVISSEATKDSIMQVTHPKYQVNSQDNVSLSKNPSIAKRSTLELLTPSNGTVTARARCGRPFRPWGLRGSTCGPSSTTRRDGNSSSTRPFLPSGPRGAHLTSADGGGGANKLVEQVDVKNSIQRI